MASEGSEGQIGSTSEAWWRLAFSAILDLGDSWPSRRESLQVDRYSRHLSWLQAILRDAPAVLHKPLFIAFDDWNLGLRAGPEWGAWVEETPYYFRTPREIALYLGMRHVLNHLAKEDTSLIPEGTADAVYRWMPRKWCILLRRASNGQFTFDTIVSALPDTAESIWCITAAIPCRASPLLEGQPLVHVFMDEAQQIWNSIPELTGDVGVGRAVPRKLLKDKARALPSDGGKYSMVIEAMKQVSGQCPKFKEEQSLANACEQMAAQLPGHDAKELCALVAGLLRTNYLFFALAPLDIWMVCYIPGRGFLGRGNESGREEAVGGLHIWLGADSACAIEPLLVLTTVYCRQKATFDYAQRAHHLLELLGDLPHTVFNYIIDSVRTAIDNGDKEMAKQLCTYMKERGYYVSSLASQRERPGDRVSLKEVAQRIATLPLYAESHVEVLQWNRGCKHLEWHQMVEAWQQLIRLDPASASDITVDVPSGCVMAFLENLVLNSLRHRKGPELKNLNDELDNLRESQLHAQEAGDAERVTSLEAQIARLKRQIEDGETKLNCPFFIDIRIHGSEVTYTDNGAPFSEQSAALYEQWVKRDAFPREGGLLYIFEALERMGWELSSFDRATKTQVFRPKNAR